MEKDYGIIEGAPLLTTISLHEWMAMKTETETLRAERAALRQCLGFFASVIKSGEPWTETCEKTYRAVLDGPPADIT